MSNYVHATSKSGKSTGFISQQMVDARKRRAHERKLRSLLKAAADWSITNDPLSEDAATADSHPQEGATSAAEVPQINNN